MFHSSVFPQWYHRSDQSYRLLPLFCRPGPGFVHCCEMFSLYHYIAHTHITGYTSQYYNWLQSGIVSITHIIKQESSVCFLWLFIFRPNYDVDTKAEHIFSRTPDTRKNHLNLSSVKTSFFSLLQSKL